MKFSLFSITAILASFVAANPILAPRAPSRPFRLQGNVGSRGSYRELAILPVTQRNGADYYQFGWYGTGSEQIQLFFTDDETMPGPVFDVRQDGYEMVLQAVQDQNELVYYRPLLLNRANTALSGLQSPSRFYNRGHFYSSPEGSDGSENPDDPDGMRWMTCIRSATMDETSLEFVEELYFSRYLPSDCGIGKISIRLGVDYVSAVPVKLAACPGR